MIRRKGSSLSVIRNFANYIITNNLHGSYKYNIVSDLSLMKSLTSKLFKNSRTLHTAIDIASQCN